MEKRGLLTLALVAGVMLLALLAACGGDEGPAPETPVTEMTPTGVVSPAPPAEPGGEELLQARCTRCHSLERVRTAAKTLDQWEHEVAHMRELGAQLTDAEAQVLVEYLAEAYGP